MSDKNRHEELKAVEQAESGEAAAEPAQGKTEPVQAEGSGEPEKTEAERLGEQISALNDKLLRTMAEYDNFRKRSQREREAVYPQATAAAVSQFIPILDTFERALAAPCGDPEFLKGVQMILQNFKEVLVKLGVEEFGETKDAFNPDIHNAVMHAEDETLEANTISEVFQKGYRMGDRIIRHAMVKVVN